MSERSPVRLIIYHLARAFGPVHLNFGPPDEQMAGWEAGFEPLEPRLKAAFATVSGTPFLQLPGELRILEPGLSGGPFALRGALWCRRCWASGAAHTRMLSTRVARTPRVASACCRRGRQKPSEAEGHARCRYLCLVSVPVGSYELHVSIWNSTGSGTRCLSFAGSEKSFFKQFMVRFKPFDPGFHMFPSVFMLSAVH